jgi:hypothetical protein
MRRRPNAAVLVGVVAHAISTSTVLQWSRASTPPASMRPRLNTTEEGRNICDLALEPIAASMKLRQNARVFYADPCHFSAAQIALQ